MSYSLEEIREGLSKIKLLNTDEEIRELYDKNPQYQHASYEEFKQAYIKIKNIIEDAKIRLAAKG